MQLFKLSTTDKSLILTKGSKGVTLNGGLGHVVINGQPTEEMRSIKKNTLVIVNGFNKETGMVSLNCIKELENYFVEVSYKYIIDNCVFEPNPISTHIDAVFVKYYIQNVIDKETALFILVMLCTYISGLFIGHCF